MLFGLARWFVPIALLGVAAALLWGHLERERLRLVLGIGLGLVALSGLGHFVGGEPSLHATSGTLGAAGGWLGVLVGGGLKSVIGPAGTIVILTALLVTSFLFLTGMTLRALVAAGVSGIKNVASWASSWWHSRPERPSPPPRETAATAAVVDAPLEPDPPAFAYDDDVDEFDDFAVTPDDAPIDESDVPPPAPARVSKKKAAAAAIGAWTLPNLDLLQRVKEQRHDRAAIDAAGEELVMPWPPTAWRRPSWGTPWVRPSRATSSNSVRASRWLGSRRCNRDIAYAMASPDVRILAPIPGRSAIGVEVPNRQRALVALGDLLSAEESLKATHPLDVPMGRDIAGSTVIVNLAEMPHVLISGATGAGKSSSINSLITSLVMRATPDQLRLMLIDPKRVEWVSTTICRTSCPGRGRSQEGRGHPDLGGQGDGASLRLARRVPRARHHQLPADDRPAGKWSPRSDRPLGRRRRDRRRPPGSTLDVEGPTGPEHLPYIVIVVDELNDLMMVAARDVEESVVRIAQMARAVGIHLVLATQRPSVDVITGVIKANIPSRMAFAVSSLADSRVILDQAGAERLIGKGDMLLLTASSNVARRLQSPWVSEDEVRRVVTAWRAQGGTAESGSPWTWRA